MKPKFSVISLLFVGSFLLLISSVHAATYTWTQNTGLGDQSWANTANWSGSTIFNSGSSDELMFFASSTQGSRLNSVAGIQNVIDVPSSLSMGTLTLNGAAPNSTTGFTVNIGTNSSTWTIGNGATGTVNLNANRDSTDDRFFRYNIAANLILNQTTIFTGNGTGGNDNRGGFNFSGNITQASGGFGITKSGTSVLILSGVNSYTGTTSVTGGTLRLSSAAALSGGIGAAGGTSALTINTTGVVELGAGNFQRNLGTGSSQFQITSTGSNAVGFSAFGGPRVITINNDASQEIQWGSTNFAPAKLVLNATTANDSLELTNRIDLNNATRTVVVNANKALLSGNIQQTTGGTAGLIKEGGGTLVLTGNNTYDGSTTITAGTLSVGAAGNFGSGTSGLIMNGGILQITGTTLTSISGIGHTVTLNNNAKGFDIHNAANTFTVDQVLSGTTFTKSGVGTLVLNQDNTFAGVTTATGGGTLVLDYSTNNGSKLPTQALNLNGTNLILRGGSHAEAVSSIVLLAATGNSISRDGSSAATIANAGALTVNALSNLTIAAAGIVSTTTANDASGIQALGRVTVGSNFAAKDGSNLLQAYGSYTSYTAGAGGGATTAVNQLTGGGTMTGTLNSYSLRIVNSGASDVLDLGVNGLNMTNGGTVLYAGGSDNNYTINGTSGQVKTNNGNQPLNINIFTGTMTLNANLGVSGSGSFAKAGEGTLVLGGSNTSTVATYIQQGVLRLANASGLGTTAGGTIVQGGAVLELSQTNAVTALDITVGAEALSITGTGISNGGALRNHSGSNTYGGLITIGASGARINSNASTALTLTGGIATTLTQDVTFGGDGNTTVSTTAISGSGRLVKDGAGILTLSAVNTYTGATLVSAGTLFVSGSLVSDVTVSDTATLAGGGTVDDVVLGGGSLFDLFLAVNSADSLAATTISFAATGFGIDNLRANGAAVDWGTISNGTYTLITGTLNSANLENFGLENALNISGGRIAYFQNGSLQLVVAAAIPEPRAALLGCLGVLLLLRRRRN